MGEPLIPEPMQRAVAAVPSRWKRAAIRAMYVTAAAQRHHGEGRLDTWPVPHVDGALGATVHVLSCERDSLPLMRMVSSLLTHAGRPRTLYVVSDGTLSARTTRAVEALDRSIEVVDWREFCSRAPLHPSIERYAHVHPLGKKLAMLVSLRDWPALVLDSDIEFYRGAHRLRLLVDASSPVPRYQDNGSDAYDQRLTDGTTVLPAVCSGVLLLPGALDWEAGLRRLAPFADSGGPWTEQTVAALALTQAHAEPLPREDYVVHWNDIKYPWDEISGRDVVLRHYLANLQRWKLWMRGGPAGYRTIPRALVEELGRTGRTVPSRAVPSPGDR